MPYFAQIMRIGFRQPHADQFERGDLAREVIDAAIIFELAVMDDDNALAQARSHLPCNDW